MSANSIQIKTSAGSPASFTYFHEATADYAILRNNSAVSIDYTQDAGATSAALAAGEVIILDITGSTSEVGVRRTDKEAASVSVELGYGFDASDIDLILKRLTDSIPVAAADITSAVTAHNADPTAHPLLVALTRALTKSNPDAVLFTASGQTIVTAQSCYARVGGVIVSIASGTSVSLPSLTAGTDYAIYLLPNGTLLASANFTAPTGYTAAQVLKLGGAHYAPGGNASAQAGGDSTPQFNPRSAWDRNFRPKCPDPRGMAFTGEGWYDIYLANTTPDLLGTSAYNAPIADGSTLPLLPVSWGGNGSATMASFSYWSATQYYAAFGKHLPRYSQLSNACYGVTENTSVGTETPTTGLDNLRTSRFGLMQATGSMWCWMDEHKDKIHQATLATGATAAQIEAWISAANALTYKDITESRGQCGTYGDSGHAVGLHGGRWQSGGNAGSRATNWTFSPSFSQNIVGSRGRSDHLILQ